MHLIRYAGGTLAACVRKARRASCSAESVLVTCQQAAIKYQRRRGNPIAGRAVQRLLRLDDVHQSLRQLHPFDVKHRLGGSAYAYGQVAAAKADGLLGINVW